MVMTKEQIKEAIEKIEEGCEKEYHKGGLVFTCGARIYGLDLCPECSEKIEVLKK